MRTPSVKSTGITPLSKDYNPAFGQKGRGLAVKMKNDRASMISLLKSGVSPKDVQRIEGSAKPRGLFEAIIETSDVLKTVTVSITHPKKPNRIAEVEFKSGQIRNAVGRAISFLESPKKVADLWATKSRTTKAAVSLL